MELEVEWLGRMPYREAWRRQRALVSARDRGEAPDTLLLLEHDAVLTLGRHATREHVLASADELERRGIEVIRVERGGEVTYHGPGQLVAYPIVRLRDRGVLLRPFVRALESAMADVASSYGVEAAARPGYPGLWIEGAGPSPRKLGALGLRVEHGITFHGIAMNVTTRLADFGLIDPCGMSGLEVTSIGRELGWEGDAAEPSTVGVGLAGHRFGAAFNERLEACAHQPSEQLVDRSSAQPADRSFGQQDDRPSEQLGDRSSGQPAAPPAPSSPALAV